MIIIRQYDKMYDEQSDGMAERRANPLQVQYVSISLPSIILPSVTLL